MGPFDGAWLAATVTLATPILLAATGELFSERAGILNVGLEGMILSGAFGGYWGAWWFGDIWLGVLAGILAGVGLAAVMAVLSVQARADQIVVGVGLNLMAIGITTFMFREIFGDRGEIILTRMDHEAIPFLSDLPGIGKPLFAQTPVVYLAVGLVVAAWVVLNKTSWGLSVRAAGEVPAAVDSAGVSVLAIRWQALLITGGFAGLAGATLSIVRLGLFQENMSAGRGFLALAAVIFGRWKPVGILGACLVFAAADSTQLRLQAEGSIPGEVWLVLALAVAGGALLVLARSGWSVGLLRQPRIGLLIAAVVLGFVLYGLEPAWSFPSQLWLALPFVVTLLALAGAAGHTQAPAALTIPYQRDHDV